MPEKYKSREERRRQLQTKGKQKGKKKKRGFFKKLFLAIVAFGIIGIIAGAGTFAYLVQDAPKLDPKLLKDPIPSKLLDMNGNIITEIGSENREYVAYKDIPKLVEDAVLATEDYRFYKHHGIDPIRLGGAVIANFTRGFGAEGGSTITQQVVKNSFLSTQKTLKRKVQEAWLAYQLEQKYTKQQIFEMYANKVLVSGRNYGMATAAKIYYGKSLKELTLPEAALIAGIPQSPNNYNPFTHPDLAERRRNIVLSLMHQHGYISKQRMEEAQKVSIQTGLLKEELRYKDEKPFDSFVDAVIDEVQETTDFNVFTDGLTIYTTLDQDAQKYVYDILNTNNVIEYPDDQFQAGIALLDTNTGEIRAIGGGRNQEVKRGFNYAIDLQRQPGSTIKPVLDYGPAIELLHWGTYQPIVDKPINYSTGKSFGNWDNKYMGQMTIKTALQLSRNSPAVQTLQAVGLNEAKDFAVNLGLPLKEIYESYAIGGLGGKTVGVSPLEMAGAYSAFGNNGIYTKPHAVTKIKLRDGTVIKNEPEPKVVMKDSTAFMISDMLKSVLVSPGSGTAARVPGLPIAGKTGTTNYSAEEIKKYNLKGQNPVPDIWFTGYTTNYTMSVWTGYKNRTTPIVSYKNQKIAQLLFKNIMGYVSKGKKTPDFNVPNSVQLVKIEKGSMPPVLASEYTPESEVITGYVAKGYAPKKVSDKYKKPDAPTNLQAQLNPDTNEVTLSWNYNNPDQADVQFNLSINSGTTQQSVTTKESSIVIPVVPGQSYTISIIAKIGALQSDPISTTIQVPAPDLNQSPGNGDGNGNNDNGNGNGNDSGNNSDNGNGNDNSGINVPGNPPVTKPGGGGNRP